MKHLKQLFTALLLLWATVANAHDFEMNGIYYRITNASNKTVAVTYRGTSFIGYSNEYTGSVVIPTTVKYNNVTYSVTSIGSDAFRGCSGLESIEIPNSVTSIGSDAFYGCTGLTSIVVENGNSVYDSRNNCNAIIKTATNELIAGCKNTVIPSNVTSIGYSAFFGCTGLTSITIPNSVTSIRSSAFYGCTSLKELYIEDGEGTLSLGHNYSSSDGGEGLFYDCPLETLYLGRNLSYYEGSYYGYSPFYNIKTLTSVTIGNSVTSIGYDAFSGCSGLESIEIPNSVTSIGRSAFNQTRWYENQPDGVVYAGRVLYTYKGEMPENTRIMIKEGTLYITDSAFSGCSGLTSFEIPNSVTSIGSSAFYGCSGLTSIEIPNSVTSIGSSAFNGCSGLKKIELNCATIGYWFSSLSSIEEVVIGNSVTSIGNSAFSGCTGLASIEIPNSVTSIGSYAFDACTSLKELYIEDGEGTLSLGYNYFSYNGGEGLFYDCPLETLYLGRNLSYNEDSDYGYSPFYNIKTLTSVTIGNGVTNIGDSAFSGCDIKKAIWLTNTPPAGYKNIGATINYVANDQYSGLRNVKVYPFLSSLFEADGVKYVPVSPAERTCDVIDCLHDSVAVEIVVKNTIIYKGISMNVKEIMPYAFYGNSYIHNIELNNDGSIGDGAFLGCSNLYYVKISNKGSIGSGSFGNCSGLIAVILEDSVSSIGASAFYGCSSLKDVSIGNGVKSIGNWAFSGCSSLDYFAFGRSVQSIGEEAFSDCNNITQIYTNATVPPVCAAQALDDINKWNCTLYVPSESKTAYQQAEQWKEFFFVNDLPTAINSVVQDKESTQPIYYDLNGRVVEYPSKGIYIINGKKVYIK